uniref:hypothetical protein n=1 Tax=Vibrio parahaemolyticus TaxID=670 RepID=UPI002738FD77|nr:hypothetical protein [Vibrio parahaemolyticus]
MNLISTHNVYKTQNQHFIFSRYVLYGIPLIDYVLYYVGQIGRVQMPLLGFNEMHSKDKSWENQY